MNDLTRIIIGYFIGLSLTACAPSVPVIPYTLATGTCLVKFCDDTLTATETATALEVLRTTYSDVQFIDIGCVEYWNGFPHEFGIRFGGLSNNRDRYGEAYVEEGVALVFSGEMSCGGHDRGLLLGNVAVHEFGHLLGMDHVDNPFSVMTGVPIWEAAWCSVKAGF